MLFVHRFGIYEGHGATTGSNPTVAGSFEAESGLIQRLDLPLQASLQYFCFSICFHVYKQQNKTKIFWLYDPLSFLQFYSTLAHVGLKFTVHCCLAPRFPNSFM